jgi:hypothetical protein
VSLTSAPAFAEKPIHIHEVTRTVVDEGQFACGDLVLTSTGGIQVERLVGTIVHGLVHLNIGRTYHHLTFSGSDGLAYRAAASAHQTVLLDAETEELISTREVIEITFRGPHGSPGHLHEIFTVRDGVERDVITGGCTYVE